jgi:hypothetical protein
MTGDDGVAGMHDNQESQIVPNKPNDLTEIPLDEDRAISRGLMILSEKSLASVFENEPDIYTVEDLKVRFR